MSVEIKEYTFISIMAFIFTAAIIIFSKTQESQNTIIKAIGIIASVVCIFFLMRVFLAYNKGNTKAEPSA
jgi:hypothetical protein